MCNNNSNHKNHNHSNHTIIGSLALRNNALNKYSQLRLMQNNIHANTAKKKDPTQSKTLRNQYSAEMYKKFRKLKGLINKSIIDNDAFNLQSTPYNVYNHEKLEKDLLDKKVVQIEEYRNNKRLATNIDPAYDFPGDSTPEKIRSFKEWLQQAIDENILELTDDSGSVLTSAEHWQNSYVRTAYSKGINHAKTILKSKGLQLPEQRIVQMFNAPIHAESLEALFMRNFDELKGITDAMSQQIARELADGMARGYNPRKIARLINDRVDKIGITRARMLARTEVIRAYNEAALNQYTAAGLTEVVAEVEFSSATDACTICLALNGNTYKIKEAHGIIPVHPNCRCAWLPVVNTNAA